LRQGRRHRWGDLFVRLLAGIFLCVAGRGGSAQSPVGGGGAGAHPYWQAPPLPSAVIQGGAIPAGWTPQAVPYQGVGPDGRPFTMYYAPTYVFTYQVGPPVLAPPTKPVASPVNRRQAPPAVPQPASMQGWNYQTQTAAPSTYSLPPATVARYQPTPYQYPPGSRALSGTPVVPPQSQPAASALPAPPPVDQWTSSGMPPSPGVVADAPPPMAPAPMSQAVAAAAPPMVAGAAGAIAAASQPQSLAPPTSIPAQPVSVSPVQPPASRAASPHLWRVVGVHDGDTVTCLDESNQQQKVRLAEIDAPEIGQEYGRNSREALAELVFGKTVEVTEDGKDRYGRWIGHLSASGSDMNRQMVATGNAWHYVDYSTDASLAALQSQAQSQRLGLWAQPNPIPPWTFRKN